MKIRTVAIVLCDNDFHGVYLPMLHSIKHLIEYLDGMDSDLEWNIREFVKRSTLAFYVGFNWRSEKDPDDHASTERYLSKARVLFNEEAEQHILNNDHDGGSWYLEVDSGIINSY